MVDKSNDELLILWTSDNKESALHMVFMYAENSLLHGWWENVTLLIWGASSKLVSGDEDIQNSLRDVQEAGVRIIACKRCAENYNIVKELEDLNIEVFYTGEFLTNWLKNDSKLITI